MFAPPKRTGAVGDGAERGSSSAKPAEEMDDRIRHQFLAVLQFLQAKNMLEAYCALESESGVSYMDGALPTAAVLESSLDMFSDYRQGRSGQRRGRSEAETEEANVRAELEKELQDTERGVCVTAFGGGQEATLGMNVTAVCWVAQRFDERLALAATADKKLRLLGEEGEVLATCTDFTSPLLGLDVAPGVEGQEAEQEVIATAMGGEATLLRLQRSPGEGVYTLEVAQKFRDHAKHTTSARFSPLPAEDHSADSAGARRSQFFITVSRDHTARVYARGSSGEFAPAGVVRLAGEVTCCCWLDTKTFVLAQREDHNLLYYDVAKEEGKNGLQAEPQERMKTNLNATGDKVVSFAVLALALSPNGKYLAACTDKSRVIVLQPYTSRQLRNLYGAVVEEYDSPTVCFSLDSTFVYATSSLPVPRRRSEDGGEGEELAGLCGQVGVFELRTGELVLHLPCHVRAVRCMQRHPHSEALVTGSFDKTVRYWG